MVEDDYGDAIDDGMLCEMFSDYLKLDAAPLFAGAANTKSSGAPKSSKPKGTNHRSAKPDSNEGIIIKNQ